MRPPERSPFFRARLFRLLLVILVIMSIQTSFWRSATWTAPLFLLLTVGSALLILESRGAFPGEQDPAVRWGGAVGPNMISAATNLPADPGSVPPLWELKLGSHLYSIPTIDRGRIYLALNDAGLDRPGVKPTGGGLVLCVDQASGKLVWQMPIPRYFDGIKPPYHFDQWNCGVCSGPVVDGDRVFVIGNRAEVLCLDRVGQANGNDGPFHDELEYMGVTEPAAQLQPTDGDIIWRYDLLTELGINGHDVCGSTLLVHGDLLYACTSNGIDDRHDKIPKPLVPSLVVLDKRTGRLVARDDEKIGQRMFHCNWSSPSAGQVGGRMLIFFGGGDGMLYAFEEPKLLEGVTNAQVLKKVWSYDCNPPGYRTRDGQPLRYSSSSKNTPDGPSEVIGTPVFYRGRVYVAIGQSSVHGVGQGCLSCVDAATGQNVWCSQLVDRTLATVSIADGLLYLPDYTGNLHCFDAETGERYWVHALESKVWCASTLVADGKVYAGTDANVLWVLQAGKEKKVLSKTRLKAVPITPAAVDGILYLPTQRALMAIPGKSYPSR
jgi:outer membrane protein assembly factor BamB